MLPKVTFLCFACLHCSNQIHGILNLCESPAIESKTYISSWLFALLSSNSRKWPSFSAAVKSSSSFSAWHALLRGFFIEDASRVQDSDFLTGFRLLRFSGLDDSWILNDTDKWKPGSWYRINHLTHWLDWKGTWDLIFELLALELYPTFEFKGFLNYGEENSKFLKYGNDDFPDFIPPWRLWGNLCSIQKISIRFQVAYRNGSLFDPREFSNVLPIFWPLCKVNEGSCAGQHDVTPWVLFYVPADYPKVGLYKLSTAFYKEFSRRLRDSAGNCNLDRFCDWSR